MITSPDNEKLKLVRKLRRAQAPRARGAVRDRGRGPGRRPASPPGASRGSLLRPPAGLPPVERRGGRAGAAGPRSRRSAPGPGRSASGREQSGPERRAGLACVYLHGVGDPGNVGTIIRTADALLDGPSSLGPGCADPFAPKAVRASMGSIFAQPLLRAELDGDPGAAGRPGRPRRRGARGAAGRRRRICLGAEREGLPARGLAAVRRRARRSPCGPGGAESLNVAAAAAIACERISSAARPESGGRTPMLERIEEIKAEAAAAIGAADLERRARGAAGPLPRPQGRADRRSCAASPISPPDERGPVGGGANKARKELEALLEASGRAARRRRARTPARRGPDRRHPARRAAAAGRPPPPDHPHHAADRGRHGRPRLPGRRRPGGRARLLQLHRAEPPAGPPGADAPGHLLRRQSRDRRTCCCAPTPRRCRCGRWRPQAAADLHRRPRQGLPARLRRHPQPDVPPDRGPGDRRGHHPRRPQGHAAGDAPGDLRRRPRDPAAAPLLPLHRAERRGRRLLLPVRRHRQARRRRALQPLQGPGLDRDPRRRHGRPQRARLRRATTATTPSGSRASPSASGSSGSRCCATACRTCGASSTTTCGCWSSSHEGALTAGWREYCDPRHRARGAGRAAGDDRDRGRADRASPARRRPTTSSSARSRRPSSTPTPTGCGSARSTSATAASGRSSAAPRTSPPARPSPSPCPGRGCRAARSCKQGEAARRRLRRDDPLRRPSSRSARTRTASWSSTTALAAGHAADARCCRSPSRCWSSRSPRTGSTASASTASPARSTRSPAPPLGPDAVGRGRAGRGRAARSTSSPRSTVEVPELCPRFTARVFTDVTDRPLAALAAGAADRRPASGRSTTSSTSPTT